ncbi:ABC transporter permease subunit [Paenibacillus sacheonensis]|uniref:ABC transporter permease subunit n=2 Tax=Paenibacillus sacheonensis TaxID=742054 RepID=A0A7X4YT40_9BACL|nr:ABC transporter permease subunit [Paenibacillus sacheonensis]
MRENASAYVFVAPFMITFIVFIAAPVFLALALSLFQFDSVTAPKFVGFDNFLSIFTEDRLFLRYALPNTFFYAVIVGPVGYALCFFLAWLINQLPKKWRDYFTLALYIPSMGTAVSMGVVWMAFFGADETGYLNRLLLQFGFIDQPIAWLFDPRYFMWIMILISLWQAMGIGFLAMLAGLQTINTELYEAGAVDGISNRLQEVWYITIPSIRPQMLFSAVMSVVGTFKGGIVGSSLIASTNQDITPGNSGLLISNHLEDYFRNRFEIGYSASLTVVLLVMIYAMTRFSFRLFGPKGDE